MSNQFKLKSAAGFTLIEIMVAISIFSIVALISVSALIIANRVNQRAQGMKIAMDNLHFALNSMSFKLRQGGLYQCLDGAVAPSNPPDYSKYKDSGRSCGSANGASALAFTTPKSAGTEQNVVVYRLEDGAIEYWYAPISGGGLDNFVPITVENLDIQHLSFRVVNTQGPTFATSPRVFISVRGVAQVGKDVTPFSLQTVVAERI
jgi:prepilin-type N-terminal cleavage/methylation domain-containing protein